MGASGKTTPASKSAKKSSASSSTSSVTPFCHRGGAEATKLARTTFDEKKIGTPADWKDGFVKDDRWVSYLPADWTPGLKMTDGGILIKVYVGPLPERKHFFHKVDLEKHLGRALSLDERGPKPLAFNDIDPKKFIKRKDTGAVAEYLNERCNKLHGLSVEEAMGLSFEHTHGKTKKYCLADLKYDLQYNRFELVDERPSQSSRPSPSILARRVSGTPRVPATPNRRVPGTPRLSFKQSIPATPKVPATPKRTIPSTPIKTARGAAPLTPPPLKRQRTSASEPPPLKLAAGSSSSSAATSKCANKPMAAKVFDSCYATLKSKAATNVTDETSIFTMIGVGTSLGLESSMLNMLPELLRKSPADRGASMQFVLKQFEQAFAR